MSLFKPRKSKDVPSHRKSIASLTEGYDVYCASSWSRVGAHGHWVCGYCQKTASDPLSPHQDLTLADCGKCGRTNRISLSRSTREG